MMEAVHTDTSRRTNSEFIRAAVRGDEEVLRMLIVHPMVDVSASDNIGMFCCVLYGLNDIVKLLLDNGADPAANDFEAYRLAQVNEDDKLTRLIASFFIYD